LRDLPKEPHARRRYEAIEDSAFGLVCEAIHAGAFRGPEWATLRHQMISAASFGTVVAYFLARSPLEDWAKNYPVNACALIADRIEADAPERVERDTPGAPSDQGAALPLTHKRRMRTPTQRAATAWRLHFATGRPQVEIARMMTEQLGQPVTQGQVSKWIKQVIAFLNAGGALPVPAPSAKSAKAVDPARLELGASTSRITPRQRSRNTPD
jgi:hypothetical protein